MTDTVEKRDAKITVKEWSIFIAIMLIILTAVFYYADLIADRRALERQERGRAETYSSLDPLGVVDACIRLNKASIAYHKQLELAERKVQNGLDEDTNLDKFVYFADIPTVKLLANIVDYHSTKTGFNAMDCMDFRANLSVLDALQGIN